ncbi:Protein MoaF [Paraburkholderia sediminicola]|uniref:Protein MoaF n=1 Tax=Paraburkholderia sediminicola TaxID=458836 RepID=A0A6J5CX16_9BURK|nr:molybdenum cofactor biosynthesis F family protein [Paraburkholderia sediminicola]CAB3745505.1 Protein MoaF [Paraburkholderia sediminicola]
MNYSIADTVMDQKYVPVENWPTLEEMAEGFAEHKYPQTSVLAGTKASLRFENGWLIEHHFVDEKTLTWTILEGEGTGMSASHSYEAMEVRPGIIFVDFYKDGFDEAVTLVWKLASGNVFAAVSSFFDRDGEKRTKTAFVTATVEGKPANEPITQSASLVGKRVLYRYSSDDWYEHVYLGREQMAWHCVNGAETGLADVEKCAYFDVAPGLTILFWTETIMPVESIVVIDFERMRSTGRFFCWDPKPNRMVHLTFGSKATLLNETTYPSSFSE